MEKNLGVQLYTLLVIIASLINLFFVFIISVMFGFGIGSVVLGTVLFWMAGIYWADTLEVPDGQ